jgi:hypothetical protein
MCLGSREDFFGGYDYSAQAGIVHLANHHLAPGKKQWTWGNHELVRLDRNLTDPDEKAEYTLTSNHVGRLTDNQRTSVINRQVVRPNYPLQKIGPAQHANLTRR